MDYILPQTYLTGDPKKPVDFEKLAQDADFRKAVIASVLNKLQRLDAETDMNMSVLFPWSTNQFGCFKIGWLTEAVAKAMAEKEFEHLKTFTTGTASDVYSLNNQPQRVVIIKQVFGTGNGLAKQITQLKTKGYEVSVICLIAHSVKAAKDFSEKYHLDMTVLMPLDE